MTRPHNESDAYKDNDNPEVVEEDSTTEVSSVSIALMMMIWKTEVEIWWRGPT